MRKTLTASLILLSMTSAPGLAAPEFPSEQLPSEQTWFSDFPVVLTATRLKQSLPDSPLPVSVIDRAMIEASGARNIVELFRLAPGMIVGYHDGHSSFATYHAIADRYARRMQILIDGRSVYTPHFGGVDWSSLPLAIENIERIEIIRAPNAATHGANALLGTISIITRDPARTEQAITNATVSAGSQGIYKVFASHKDTVGEVNYRLTASRWGDAGFEQPAGFADDRDITLFNVKANWQSTPATQWVFGFGAGREDALTSQPQAILIEPPHPEITRRQYQQISWYHQVPDGQWEVRFYHTAEQVEETFVSIAAPPFGGIMVNRDRSIESKRFDFEISRDTQFSPSLRTVWGLGIRHDGVRSPSYFSQQNWLTYERYKLFGQAEWRLANQWLINAGLMAEYSEISDLDFSPSLALNYAFAPQHTLRLSVSRAVRTPVLLEERANQRFAAGGGFVQVFAASGDLDSEKITALDLGYLGQFPDVGVTVDARLFYSRITELISYYERPYPASLPGITLDFRNRDDLQIRGFETQVQFQPIEASRLIVNYAYTDLRSSDLDEVYSKSGPRHNFSLLGIQELPANYQASLGFYYMSESDGVDTGTYIPNTRRMDVKLAKTWHLGHNQRLEASITIQSVLGEYQDFRSINVFDTRAYLKLRFWF